MDNTVTPRITTKMRQSAQRHGMLSDVLLRMIMFSAIDADCCIFIVILIANILNIITPSVLVAKSLLGFVL
jgi:hypothetical protein